MYDTISTIPQRMGIYMSVRVVGCLHIHIKIKNDIKEIHQNVNRGSWIPGFNSFFYSFQYVSIFFIISILYFYDQNKLLNKSYIYLQGCVNHTRSLSIDVISPLWNCYSPQLYCYETFRLLMRIPCLDFPLRSHPPSSPIILSSVPLPGVF